MKTMTCRQMGGPCDQAFTGNTPDEIMNQGAAHVNELAGKGDAAHIEAKNMMDKSATDGTGEEWLKKFQADFAATPDNQ